MMMAKVSDKPLEHSARNQVPALNYDYGKKRKKG